MRARKTRERDTVRDGHREAGKGGLALLQACWDAFKRAYLFALLLGWWWRDFVMVWGALGRCTGERPWKGVALRVRVSTLVDGWIGWMCVCRLYILLPY